MPVVVEVVVVAVVMSVVVVVVQTPAGFSRGAAGPLTEGELPRPLQPTRGGASNEDFAA